MKNSLTALFRTIIIVIACFFLRAKTEAQVEVAHLFSKGYSATGFGTFLHVGVPLPSQDEISAELGLYYFGRTGNHMIYVPVLVGYRHFFNTGGAGLYIEPFLGYSFGATDIPKTDSLNQIVYNSSGNEMDQKASGLTAGLGCGYVIPSAKFPLNIGLRYQRIFVTGGDPGINTISLRLSFALYYGRRER
jgi:hypothetical protein